MTLTVTWIVIIVSSIVIIGSTSLTTNAVERLSSKFEIHQKLCDANVTITIAGKRLEDRDKIEFLNNFNEAIFLKKHNVIRGTEELFLHPKNSEKPLIIDMIKGKKVVKLFVYRYNDRIEVVKQYKKKLAAYSLRSDRLQKSRNLYQKES